jgi:hypothetical protein
VVGRIVTQKRCSKNAEVLQRDSFGDLRQLPCSEKKLIVPGFHPFSCRQWFQVIFVMQTTQDRVPYHNGTKSKHSRRMLPIHRSQNVFAWGARNGVLRCL